VSACEPGTAAVPLVYQMFCVQLFPQHCHCLETSDCIDYWKCSSLKEVTYFSELLRLHPSPLFPLLVELMLSLSPREAHFVRCVASFLLRHLSLLQRLFLLMDPDHSVQLIANKRILPRLLNLRLFDGNDE
jgi:hypothetical protein